MSSNFDQSRWGMKVLIVESDKQTRLAIMEGLERAGFKTFGAESNGEALSFIDQEIEVVVFDIAMTECGVIDLIDEWTRRKPTTKLIVCSRDPDKRYIKLIRSGAHSCFGHATNTGRVLDAIRRSFQREDDAESSIQLPPGYTLESAKALLDQGKSEHEEGKLTLAADAWEEGWNKWNEEVKRWLKQFGTKM